MKRYGTLIIGVLLLVGIILYFSGGMASHHSSKKNQDTINTNVTVLAARETQTPTVFAEIAASNDAAITDEAEIEAEQQKIVDMEGDSFDNAALIKRYNGSVVVGDSMVEASYEYDWLNTSIVYGKIGVSVCNGGDLVDAAMNAGPAYMFLCYGINDIENYVSDSDSFIDDYREMLEHIQSTMPDLQIYVCALFPPEEGLEETKTFYKYRDDYNTKLEALCEEMSVHFVDCSFLLEQMPELYDADGVHPVSKFYPLWYTYLADIAGLPEDE